MSLLSHRLQLKVSQKQILTPGLVQMVTVLQLNRLELRDMIVAEMAANPVLEESAEAGEELTPSEVQTMLEAERSADPNEQSMLEMMQSAPQGSDFEAPDFEVPDFDGADNDGRGGEVSVAEVPEAKSEPSDSFEEIDFGSHFDDWLDPGFKSPASESVEKPSFETFLSAPVTLSDHLQSQLAIMVMAEDVRDAALTIVGNLDENGYLTCTNEEIAQESGCDLATVERAVLVVQSLEPAGVGARSMQECLLLQMESRNGRGGVAWQILKGHMRLLETRQYKEIARQLGRPIEHVQVALNVIRHLDPRPGLRYAAPSNRQVEPDVTIAKDGEDYVIQLNDEDIPQLRLNGQYRRMLDREAEPNKDVRNYVKEKYAAALQLIKNIEQRKQTIMKVCHCIVQRQRDLLENGIDRLKPMMIKEVAEEIGVHPSTVSRAVAGKYAHTPQGVFELRYFFSEAVQGIAGSSTPLLVLKRRVKQMIDEEDSRHPLTDDAITARLQAEGIQVTRRTVAKYREDMKIPSTHQRRRRE